jgi:hypothetical protein
MLSSMPIVQAHGGVFKLHEFVGFQAFCAEPAIEGFDEVVVRWGCQFTSIDRDATKLSAKPRSRERPSIAFRIGPCALPLVDHA